MAKTLQPLRLQGFRGKPEHIGTTMSENSDCIHRLVPVALYLKKIVLGYIGPIMHYRNAGSAVNLLYCSRNILSLLLCISPNESAMEGYCSNHCAFSLHQVASKSVVIDVRRTAYSTKLV
jgi:hypothetical protein